MPTCTSSNLQYDGNTNKLTADGGVVMEKGDMQLRGSRLEADRIFAREITSDGEMSSYIKEAGLPGTEEAGCWILDSVSAFGYLLQRRYGRLRSAICGQSGI